MKSEIIKFIMTTKSQFVYLVDSQDRMFFKWDKTNGIFHAAYGTPSTFDKSHGIVEELFIYEP